MSAAVVASRSMTGHSVIGVRRIAFTRSTNRDIAAEDMGSAAGLGGGDPAAEPAAPIDPVSAARLAPQLPQNVAPSAIVVPHFGQFMSRAPSVGTVGLAAPFCAKARGDSTR